MENREYATPRDVFVHLLTMSTLYVSIVSFITLIFQYVNILLPDALSYGITGPLDGVRWTSAALIVVFPVFLGLSYMLERDFAKNPNRHDLRIRKWLVHFTLFAAAITIIVELARLVYIFYSGELSTQFALKVLVVLAVAGAVFGYYLWDLRRGTTKSIGPKIWASVTGIIVLVSLVAGVFIAGTPSEQRALRFDDRRVNDLSAIQGQVINFWSQKGSMPKDLVALRDDISGFVAPVDPLTGKSYEYRVTGPLSFELCADFAKPSKSGNSKLLDSPRAYPSYAPYGDNWEHEAGKKCYTRTIDPDIYKPVPITAPPKF